MDLKTADPKGLIRESYRIEGITPGECRSVFMDWALSLPLDVDTAPILRHLLATYGLPSAKHPMSEVLRAALEVPQPPERRGGRGGRHGYERDRG